MSSNAAGVTFNEVAYLNEQKKVTNVRAIGTENGFSIMFTRTDGDEPIECVVVSTTAKKVRMFKWPDTLLTNLKKMGINEIADVDLSNWNPENMYNEIDRVRDIKGGKHKPKNS